MVRFTRIIQNESEYMFNLLYALGGNWFAMPLLQWITRHDRNPHVDERPRPKIRNSLIAPGFIRKTQDHLYKIWFFEDRHTSLARGRMKVTKALREGQLLQKCWWDAQTCNESRHCPRWHVDSNNNEVWAAKQRLPREPSVQHCNRSVQPTNAFRLRISTAVTLPT